jgi:hypothetical protein
MEFADHILEWAPKQLKGQQMFLLCGTDPFTVTLMPVRTERGKSVMAVQKECDPLIQSQRAHGSAAVKM